MANKAIGELPEALNVNNQDLFVLEQSGIAKKLPAETFITEQGIINALAEALDGHGGIQSVTLSSVSGRIRTYRITFTDQSATTFQVYDGTSIDRISRTSSSGLDDVYTVFLSDGTTTFFTVHNGADGDVSEAMLNDALKDKAPAVTETTESSAIATFADGADDMPIQSLVAEIDPVQDLHGLSYPYPAGSQATNLFKATAYKGEYNATVGTDLKITTDVMAYSLSSEGVTVHVTTAWRYRLFATDSLSAGTYSVRTQQISSAARGTVYVTDSDLKVVSVVYNQSYAGFSAVYAVTIEEGQRIAYAVGSTNVADELVNFAVVEGSTISNLPLFENICPITGHTEVNATRAGKNLFSGDSEYTRTDAGYYIKTDVYSPMALNLVAGTYTISIKSTTAGQGQLEIFGNSTSNRLINASMTMIVGTASYTFTINENCGYIRFYGNFVGTISDIQIETGSTATAYKPYITPETFTISWQTEAGTVYGGTIDVATGLLTVNNVTVDMGDLTWGKSTGTTNFFFVSLSTVAIGTNNILCSQYKTVPSSNDGAFRSRTDDNIINTYIGGHGIRVKDTSRDSLSENEFKTAMSGVQLVYELATPQTYQLTPQEVKTLLGTNNVWADTGNVSVTYVADTKLYIEKLTMPTEDDLVANQAIISGKYFMIGNSLYLALANIASGAQITIGTNAQRVSLADALNAINT